MDSGADRKARLAALRKKKEAQGDATASRKVVFRNYRPRDDTLKANALPPPKLESDVVVSKAEEVVRAAQVESELVNVVPVKENWDLKREMKRKMEALHEKTQDAIVDLIKARLKEEAGDESSSGSESGSDSDSDGSSDGEGGGA